MRRIPRKLLFFFFALVLLPFAARVVSAQPSEGERKSQARILYQEGVKLQEAGSYAEALTKFEAAQKQYNAPTHLLHMAECQAMLGKLIDATENYRVLSRMNLPADAPQAFVAAQQQGAAELPAVEARIPQLKLEIKDPPIASLKNLQITLNGKPVPVELVGVSRPIDPGKYKVNAFADGSGWMYADNGLAPLVPQKLDPDQLRDDRGYLLEHASDIARDERAARIATSLGVRYAYLGPRRFPSSGRPWFTEQSLTQGGWTVVHRNGTTVVLERPASD